MANWRGWCRQYPSDRYLFIPMAASDYLERRRSSIPFTTVYPHWIDFNSSTPDIHFHEGVS